MMSGHGHSEGEDGEHGVLDALLAEVLGGRAPSELSARVLSRSADEAAAAAAARVHRAAAAPKPGRWARQHHVGTIAAIVVLTLGVWWGVARLRESASSRLAQDPLPPAGAVVPIESLTQLQARLTQVVRIEFEVERLGPPDLPVTLDLSGVPVTAAADQQARILAGLARDVRVVDPAGWEWQNRLSLVLASGERLALSIGSTERRAAGLRVGLRGLQGDLRVTGAAAVGLGDLRDAGVVVACLAHGIVRSPADLNGSAAFPPSLEELRLFGVADADLAALSRFRQLRVVDASGLGKGLSIAGVRHLAALDTLEELRLERTDLGDDALAALAAGTAPLRRLSLRGNRRVTADGIEAVAAMPTLRELDLREVPAAAAAAAALAASHPALTVAR